jgi:hypothetical protein
MEYTFSKPVAFAVLHIYPYALELIYCKYKYIIENLIAPQISHCTASEVLVSFHYAICLRYHKAFELGVVDPKELCIFSFGAMSIFFKKIYV